MKTFVSITVFDNSPNLDDSINAILMSDSNCSLFVFDATKDGMHSEYKRFIKSYNNYGVYYQRIKAAGRVYDRNTRINLGISYALLRFNHTLSGYDSFVHITHDVVFSHCKSNFQMLRDNALIFHCVSPVIESAKGLEMIFGQFDRFGIEPINITDEAVNFVTGEVEESFALNPICFAMSKPYANKFKRFPESDREPADFLNQLVYQFGSGYPKIDTSTFVEHIY